MYVTRHGCNSGAVVALQGVGGAGLCEHGFGLLEHGGVNHDETVAVGEPHGALVVDKGLLVGLLDLSCALNV